MASKERGTDPICIALRDSIDGAIEASRPNEALADLDELFLRAPSLSTAHFVLNRVRRIGRPAANCRVFFLRSFTVEPVIALLRASAALHGIDLSVRTGEFNTFRQEICDPHSALYGFEPDIAVLAVQSRDAAGDLWDRSADLSAPEVIEAIERTAHEFRDLIGTFRSHSRASLIVHNLEAPAMAARGVYDSQAACGQKEAIARINAEIRRICADHAGIYLLDYDGLVARHGRERWHDEGKWLSSRMPIAVDCLNLLAREYLRFFLPLTGKVCKAVAVDLDNMLWGGVIGEDGPDGIIVGGDYPGAAFRAVQRALLDIRSRGILLAVASKNNHSDAMEALDGHPEMLVRSEHFASLQINWDDKAESLRRIAKELNIGLDTVAFVDDNPAERRRIRMELPEVTVIELPSDPMDYARAIRECPELERLSLFAEDHERGRMYSEQRARESLRQSTGSLEKFYRSLAMVVEIAPVTPQTLGRAAQLTQKTNQLNVTTRRYTEQELASMATNFCHRIHTVRVRDRFGDNGLVGLIVTRLQGDTCEIDTMLLSCRVIGRTVESAMLWFVGQDAASLGASRVVGRFVSTTKNAPARDIYRSHGFAHAGHDESGEVWELDLSISELSCPDWIRLNPAVEGSAASVEP